MKAYEPPFCRVKELILERPFVVGASAGGLDVDPVRPFGAPFRYDEEGDDYE